jgi:dUTP pyrophosphatase
MRILITRVGASSSEGPLPSYATAGAAGLDLSAAISEPITIAAGEYQLVPCGFAVAIPDGFEAQIRPRSGLASKHGVTVLNSPGTIDSDYRGEVKVLLINPGKTAFTVAAGMRIAQMIVAPVAHVEWQEAADLPATTRHDGGFGHSGT